MFFSLLFYIFLLPNKILFFSFIFLIDFSYSAMKLLFTTTFCPPERNITDIKGHKIHMPHYIPDGTACVGDVKCSYNCLCEEVHPVNCTKVPGCGIYGLVHKCVHGAFREEKNYCPTDHRNQAGCLFTSLATIVLIVVVWISV